MHTLAASPYTRPGDGSDDLTHRGITQREPSADTVMRDAVGGGRSLVRYHRRPSGRSVRSAGGSGGPPVRPDRLCCVNWSRAAPAPALPDQLV